MWLEGHRSGGPEASENISKVVQSGGYRYPGQPSCFVSAFPLMEQSVSMKIWRCRLLTHPRSFQVSPIEPMTFWAQSLSACSRQETTLTRVEVVLDPGTENFPNVSHLTAQTLNSHVYPTWVLAGGFPHSIEGTQASRIAELRSLRTLTNSEKRVESITQGFLWTRCRCVRLFHSHSTGQDSVTRPHGTARVTRMESLPQCPPARGNGLWCT